MNNNYFGVIMAGGIGSRFWPMGTEAFPKQFQDFLGSGESLIQNTYARLKKTIPYENILISTNTKYKNLVQEQLHSIPEKQLLLEPSLRDTSAGVLYAALKINSINPNGVMVIAPSDHLIDDEEAFGKKIKAALDYCQQNDVLMTLGIEPSSPNTGYGYIQYKESADSFKKVKQFTEKPTIEIAEEFIKSGDYLWNSGIFIWSVKSILKMYKTALPEMFELLSGGTSVYNTENEIDFINNNYSKAERISIDFGILEKANNIYVLPVDFGWDDLGTWGSFHDKLPKDEQHNAAVGGDVIFRDASNNIVRTQPSKKVVIQGLENFIVVENEDVLLICPKNAEQDIKEISLDVKNIFGKEYT